MKLKEIEIGGRYTAKVSGRLQVVRVLEIREAPGWGPSGRSTTRIEAINEATGRKITIRSPQRLRSRVTKCQDGMEV